MHKKMGADIYICGFWMLLIDYKFPAKLKLVQIPIQYDAYVINHVLQSKLSVCHIFLKACESAADRIW